VGEVATTSPAGGSATGASDAPRAKRAGGSGLLLSPEAGLRGRRVPQALAVDDVVDADRSVDVLELPLAQELELHPLVVAHVIVDALGDGDAAGPGDALHAGRHVDGIAEDVVADLGLAEDDVSHVNADGELQVGIVAQGALDLEGAAHRLDGALEGAHDAVADLLEPLPFEIADETPLDLAAAGDDPDGRLLVCAHGGRVAHDVAEHHGDDSAALFRHFLDSPNGAPTAAAPARPPIRRVQLYAKITRLRAFWGPSAPRPAGAHAPRTHA
jgi:hypothetical protein